MGIVSLLILFHQEIKVMNNLHYFMTSSVIIILYIILGTSNADRYLLVEVGDELILDMESNLNKGPLTRRRSISTNQLDKEAVPNENRNHGKQSGYRWSWLPPPMKTKTTAPAPPPIPIDCEMGEWVTHGECSCEHETPCLLRDGSPGLPYSSGETCRRKQTKSIVKEGAHGGRNDCKKIDRTEICTEECRKPKPLPTTTTPVAWTTMPKTAPPQSGAWRAWAHGGHRRWKPRATPPPPPSPVWK